MAINDPSSPSFLQKKKKKKEKKRKKEKKTEHKLSDSKVKAHKLAHFGLKWILQPEL
jgi:hypothetical protein